VTGIAPAVADLIDRIDGWLDRIDRLEGELEWVEPEYAGERAEITEQVAAIQVWIDGALAQARAAGGGRAVPFDVPVESLTRAQARVAAYEIRQEQRAADERYVRVTSSRQFHQHTFDGRAYQRRVDADRDAARDRLVALDARATRTH
jgi:hypothetical protein